MIEVAAIPTERLEEYAEAASTLGDLRHVMTALRRVSADLAMLESGDNALAETGARAMLADVVRRLCATMAGGEVDAEQKIRVLAGLARSYVLSGSPEDLRVAAMVGEAISIEAREWGLEVDGA